MLEIKSGLPYREVSFINNEGEAHTINISTEGVQELITKYLDAYQGREEFLDECKAFEAFDNDMAYFVPDYIFEATLIDLLGFLHEVDDELGIKII